MPFLLALYRVGTLEVSGDKQEQLPFVKCPCQASHLANTVRGKGSQHVRAQSGFSNSPPASSLSFATLLGLLAQQLAPTRTSGSFSQQSRRASTRCQANVVSHFSGEEMEAVPHGLPNSLRMAQLSLPVVPGKCHRRPSRLPGELKLPAVCARGEGGLSSRPSPLAGGLARTAQCPPSPGAQGRAPSLSPPASQVPGPRCQVTADVKAVQEPYGLLTAALQAQEPHKNSSPSLVFCSSAADRLSA